MTLFGRIAGAWRRWRRDERGSVAVETLLMVPLMAWAFLSTLVYFDAYRAEAVNEKASLTIADMFSREKDFVDNKYMDGALSLLKYLALHDDTPQLRVTAFKWHVEDDAAPDTGAYQVVWSKVRGTTKSELDDAMLIAKANRLPIMTKDERALLIETWVDYDEPYNPGLGAGLGAFEIDTFTVISPRFSSRVCWVDDASAPNADALKVC